MTPSAALLVAFLGFAALALFSAIMGAAVYLGYARSRARPRKVQGDDAPPAWEPRMAALEVQMDGMRGLWEEERRRAEQARDRERYYASKSRRRRREESDDDDDAGDDVRDGDAPASGAQGVLPLSTGMGNGSVPAEPEHLRRAREAYGYPWGLVS
jgi:hypothetical protein